MKDSLEDKRVKREYALFKTIHKQTGYENFTTNAALHNGFT